MFTPRNIELKTVRDSLRDDSYLRGKKETTMFNEFASPMVSNLKERRNSKVKRKGS
jgi:hypothetical protein